MNKPINWKLFFILWIATILGTIAVIPYVFEQQADLLESIDLPMSLPVLIALQIAQSAVLFGLLIVAGLFFANRVGLTAPILDTVTKGESAADKIRSILLISVLVGVIASLMIIGLEFAVFQPALTRELGDAANALNPQSAQPAAWKGFLASFYGGIVEEVLLRLFVMSLLVWLGSFVSKTAEGKPTNAVFWIANILTAVLFGLGHLPATAILIPLTPLVITRAIVLNGLAGIAFGYLYWKRGLESAMIAHFSTDIVLHVLFAL